jgi:hypothetical protein
MAKRQGASTRTTRSAMPLPISSMNIVLVVLAGLVVRCDASIGLTGIDTWPNSPFCAHACYGSLSSYRLSCSVIHGDPDDHDAHVMTSADCRADNFDFLTSLAWCLSTKCEDLSTSELETFWEATSTGDPAVQPVWSYRQALANITAEPTMELGHGGTINATVVTPYFWNVLYGTYSTLYQEGWNMNVFGYVRGFLPSRSSEGTVPSYTDSLH